jgi:hypothetical protein
MNLTLITPCSRPQYLKFVAESIDFQKIKQWIIVYDTSKGMEEKKQFLDNPKVLELFENAETHGVVSVYGNFQRLVALSKIESGYVFCLDDDTCLLPDFLSSIEEYVDTPDKWYSFDVKYGHTAELKGNFSTQQDAASICFDISIMRKFDICWGDKNGWCMTGRGADSNFVGQFRVKAMEYHTYIPKKLAAHNELRHSKKV